MSDIPDAIAPNSLPTPPISVVVCTRDRADLLRQCLHALQKLVYPCYEVIVVDNASRDAAVRATVAATPFRYVLEPRPGLDWARNRGLAEARYDLIAYVDDDALVVPGWLRALAAAFADAGVAAVTGRVLSAELVTEAQLLFEQYSGMSKGHRPRLFEGWRLAPRQILAAHQVGVGTNMALRRATIERVGSFDTALDVGTAAGGAGDIDMFHRILAAGLTIRYEPAALVYHRHRPERSALRRQIEQNGRCFGVYLLKIWAHRTVSRRATARFALGWIGGWLLARLAARLRGRLHFPLDLVWAEIWGALQAPAAYRASYRHDRRLRQYRYPAVAAQSEKVYGS